MDNNVKREVKIIEEGDLNEALAYLLYREENPSLSKVEVAEHFGITPQGLNKRIRRWERAGIMERARAAILVPKVEDINHAINQAVQAFPDIIRGLVQDALTAEKFAHRIAAARMLHKLFVDPAIQKMPESGSEELIYVTEAQDFLPTHLQFTEDEETEI